MSAWRPEDDFDDESWDEDDRDAPQESDLVDEDEDETPTVPCPRCGREVAEFAERCPYCGDWIIPSAGGGRRPLWIVVAAIMALAAFLVWMLL
jgi:hypothetical protein